MRTVLLSGVIQYLENPYIFLNKLLTYKFSYLIFDRTIVFRDNKVNDRLTVQRVSQKIYKASYPCWIFNEKKFVDFFNDKYKLAVDFIAHEGTTVDLKDVQAIYKGYLFEINRKLKI